MQQNTCICLQHKLHYRRLPVSTSGTESITGIYEILPSNGSDDNISLPDSKQELGFSTALAQYRSCGQNQLAEHRIECVTQPQLVK
jgi:hypothetical protein